jgi:hypothetical protein
MSDVYSAMSAAASPGGRGAARRPARRRGAGFGPGFRPRAPRPLGPVLPPRLVPGPRRAARRGPRARPGAARQPAGRARRAPGGGRRPPRSAAGRGPRPPRLEDVPSRAARDLDPPAGGSGGAAGRPRAAGSGREQLVRARTPRSRRAGPPEAVRGTALARMSGRGGRAFLLSEDAVAAPSPPTPPRRPMESGPCPSARPVARPARSAAPWVAASRPRSAFSP